MSRSEKKGKAEDRQSFKPAKENQGTYLASLCAGIRRAKERKKES